MCGNHKFNTASWCSIAFISLKKTHGHVFLVRISCTEVGVKECFEDIKECSAQRTEDCMQNYTKTVIKEWTEFFTATNHLREYATN